LFDVNEPATIVVNETCRVRVRYPTDSEWLAWSAGQTGKMRDGEWTPNVAENERRAVKLFKTIRLDGPQINGRQAAQVIDSLDDLDISGCFDRERGELNVDLVAFGITTQHILRLPTPRELARLGVTVHRKGFRRIVRSVAPAAALYDELYGSHYGYAGAVPVNHKVGIIGSVVGRITDDPQAFQCVPLNPSERPGEEI